MQTDAQTDTMTGSARSAATMRFAGKILAQARPFAFLLGGSALVAAGVRRRSTGAILLAAAGAALLYRMLHVRHEITPAHQNPEQTPESLVKIKRTITIGAPAKQVYETIRSPEALAHIGAYIADISFTDQNTARVSLRRLLDSTLDLTVAEDRPGELLQWKSVPDLPWLTTAEVLFRPAPAERGTETTLHIRFVPPAGQLGAALVKKVGIVPDTIADTFLHRLKSLVETGEIPTNDYRATHMTDMA